ncbi:MAG: rhomboid family intramembrane serine protease [Vicinamibacterales bacterium]
MPPTRPRYSPPSFSSSSFGPGALTPAVRALIVANVALFVLTFLVPEITLRLGLRPADVFGRFAIWQPVTYMFLHGSLSHILFNMLGLWMFGVELERTWGTAFFARYYAVCGVGAAATTLLASLFPGSIGDALYPSLTIGASGAVYGLLLAYGQYYPNRPIYFWMIFPIPARYFVLIIGAISLFLSMSQVGGVAHTAHLGGIVAGYLYLKGGRMRPMAELTYRYQRWKIDRHRRKFDVYPGGRGPGPRVH